MNIGDVDFQGQQVDVEVVTNAGEVIKPPNIAVFSCRNAYETGFFPIETFWKAAGVDHHFEYSREAAIIFRNDEEKLFSFSNNRLKGLKACRLLFVVHVSMYDVVREGIQGHDRCF